jgi:hypothetical protein
MLSFALSITVLAAIALLAGAAWLWRRPGYRKQALLMIVLALVAIANVAIWTLPDREGNSPAGQLADEGP